MCGIYPGPYSGTTQPIDTVMDKLEAELAGLPIVSAKALIQQHETVQETRAHPEAQPDQDPAVRGLRFNKGKVRLDLMPVEPIFALGRLLTKGAEKYAERNWEKGMPYKDAIGSLERHWFAWKAGEDSDPETGENHLTHVLCNAMFLLCWVLRGVGTDDRVKVPQR